MDSSNPATEIETNDSWKIAPATRRKTGRQSCFGNFLAQSEQFLHIDNFD